jgi:hypothetical protein
VTADDVAAGHFPGHAENDVVYTDAGYIPNNVDVVNDTPYADKYGCSKFYDNFMWDDLTWLYDWPTDPAAGTSSAPSSADTPARPQASSDTAARPQADEDPTTGTNFSLFGRAVLIVPFELETCDNSKTYWAAHQAECNPNCEISQSYWADHQDECNPDCKVADYWAAHQDQCNPPELSPTGVTLDWLLGLLAMLMLVGACTRVGRGLRRRRRTSLSLSRGCGI